MGKKWSLEAEQYSRAGTWIRVPVVTYLLLAQWTVLEGHFNIDFFFVISLDKTFKSVYPMLSAREASRNAPHSDKRIDCHWLFASSHEQPQHWQWSGVAGFGQVVTSKPQLQGIICSMPILKDFLCILSVSEHCSWTCGLSYIRKYPVNLIFLIIPLIILTVYQCNG